MTQTKKLIIYHMLKKYLIIETFRIEAKERVIYK